MEETNKIRAQSGSNFISNFKKVDRMVEMVREGQPTVVFNNIKMDENEPYW
jgi:hypothetical protein